MKLFGIEIRRIKNAQPSSPALQHAIRHLRAVLPTGRQSTDVYSQLRGLLRTEMPFEGYPNDSAYRLRKIIRLLCQYDEDVAQAVRNYQALANPGHSLEIIGNEQAVADAAAEIERWQSTVYPEGGSLDALANNQIAEAYKSGASSIEWITLNRSGVDAAIVLEAERIAIQRDATTQQLIYIQHDAGVPITLNNQTYKYAALSTDGGSLYGIPVPLAALEALDRKARLQNIELRVLKLMERIALITAEVPPPTPEQLGLPPGSSTGTKEYETRLTQFYNEVASLLVDNAQSDAGVYLAPAGVEINAIPTSPEIAGIEPILLHNRRRVWTGIASLSFLHNHMDSTTEALASVVFPIMEAIAVQLQKPVATQMEFGINLHLRLRGIPATMRWVFDQAKSAFARDETEIAKMQAETHKIMAELLGTPYLRRIAQDYGIDPDEVDSTGAAASRENATLKLRYDSARNTYRAAR